MNDSKLQCSLPQRLSAPIHSSNDCQASMRDWASHHPLRRALLDALVHHFQTGGPPSVVQKWLTLWLIITQSGGRGSVADDS